MKKRRGAVQRSSIAKNAQGKQRRGKNTESTEKRRARSRRFVALDLENPPFIPKKHRDGAEIAKGAKDGAPSSSNVRGATERIAD
jgi:hypothetical protein